MARKPPSPLAKAKRIVGAQYAPIDHALRIAQKQSAAQQQALNDARLALVQQLQQGVAPAGQVYDQAVQQQQALAQSGAKLLSDANPNAALQANLQAIGAPQEQQAQTAQSLQSLFPGAGSVLNVQEGTVPGASLLAQKAASQGYLAGLPTVAALSGEQSLRSLLASAADTRNKLLEQRLQVGGQLPALAQTLAQQGVENAQADRSFAFQRQQAQSALQQAALDRQFRAQQAELDRAAQAATTPYEQAQIALEQQKLTLARQEAKQTQASGGLTPYESAQIGLAQQRIDISKGKKSTSPTSTKGFTPLQLQRYRGQATSLAEVARHGGTDRAGNPLQPLTYDQAVREMEKAGIPLRVAVGALNRVYPAQYKVTKRGLKQVGLRGHPSWRPGG